MTEITIEALKLRRRELQINKAMTEGAIDEISHIIAEMERRRGGRPRKAAATAITPLRVAGSASHEPETDEQGELPSIDDVRGILKTEESLV